MSFQQGDQVVHYNFGLGKVVSIEGMDFPDKEPRMFYRIEFNQATVWVPFSKQDEGDLRTVTPKSKLSSYCQVLKSPARELDSDFRKRRAELEQRLHEGTFQALCEVVRDLYAQKQKRSLSTYDKTLYQRAREALIMEWSTAGGIARAEAIKLIDGCLKQGVPVVEEA